MFINRSIICGHPAEIVRLLYTISLDNGFEFDLKEGDLVAFLKAYAPSIDLTPYFQPVVEHLKHNQANSLMHLMRYKLNPVFEKHFAFGLADIEFGEAEKDELSVECFDALVQANDVQLFFSLCDELFQEVVEGKRQYSITREIDFNHYKWNFKPESMFLDDDESTIIVKKSTIDQIVAEISADFKQNGADSLAYLEEEKTRHAYYASVDFFLNNFLADLKALKTSVMTYDAMRLFLHKYKIPERSSEFY